MQLTEAMTLATLIAVIVSGMYTIGGITVIAYNVSKIAESMQGECDDEDEDEDDGEWWKKANHRGSN